MSGPFDPRALRRVAELRAEQAASGKPVVMCGYCRGDTRYDDFSQRFATCECCGAYLRFELRPDGYVWEVPVCPGPLARNAQRGARP